MYLLIGGIAILLFIILLIKSNIITDKICIVNDVNELNNTTKINNINNISKNNTNEEILSSIDSVLNKKKYCKKTNTFPKCLKFEKSLIDKINKILDNKSLKTKHIVKKLEQDYKIIISTKDLNKGILKWLLCRNIIKYNKDTFTYCKN